MNKKHLTLKGKLPSEKLYSFFFFLLSTLHVTMLVMIVAAVATLICRIFVLGFSEIKKKKSCSVIIKDEWTGDRKCLIMTNILSQQNRN